MTVTGGIPDPASQGDGTGLQLRVRVADGDYRCRLGRGGEVGPVPALTPLPLTPPWLSGLVLLEDEVLPVVDLGRVLGLGGGEQGETIAPARMLTYREPGLGVGFLVSAVDAPADPTLPELELSKVASALMDRLRSSVRPLSA